MNPDKTDFDAIADAAADITGFLPEGIRIADALERINGLEWCTRSTQLDDCRALESAEAALEIIKEQDLSVYAVAKSSRKDGPLTLLNVICAHVRACGHVDWEHDALPELKEAMERVGVRTDKVPRRKVELPEVFKHRQTGDFWHLAWSIKGLMVLDWWDRQAESKNEVGSYFKTGKLKHKETVVKGIDKAVGAFLGLFQGQNLGKMMVDLA
jgi:hypothetical protein